MVEDKAFFSSALTSSDYNNLMNYDYQCICNFYREVAQRNGDLNEEIQFLLEFYCHGSMDMTAEWVRNGMKLSPKEMSERLIQALPAKLEPYLSTLSQCK